MTHVSDTDDSLYLTLFSSLPDKESSNRSSISEERRYWDAQSNHGWFRRT